MVAVGASVLGAAHLSGTARARAAVLAVLPFTVVAVLHLSRHAAWLRIAGTSGAVPAFLPGPLGWMLMTLALAGVVAARRATEARITIWFAAGIGLQALALWLLARARGAETPYMAMKMIYLAIYPVAVLAAIGLGSVVQRSRLPAAAARWLVAIAVLALGIRTAVASLLAPPLVDLRSRRRRPLGPRQHTSGVRGLHRRERGAGLLAAPRRDGPAAVLAAHGRHRRLHRQPGRGALVGGRRGALRGRPPRAPAGRSGGATRGATCGATPRSSCLRLRCRHPSPRRRLPIDDW